MQTIKAVVTDLDDTLLNSAHELTDRSANTLRRLVSQGVKVILASGRSGASMRPFVQKSGTPYPYIAFNGAQVIDAQTGEVLLSNEIAAPLAREALRYCQGLQLYTQVYRGDDWFYETECEYSRNYGKSSGVIGVKVPDLYAFLDAPAPKLLCVDTPERIQAILPEARRAFAGRLSVTTSKPYFLEITAPEATKGEALRALAARIGLSPETTICAGDSLNDLSMLSWSRLPVTVENARPEVKAAAWRVCGDGRHDGLAALLDELIPANSR